MRTVAVLLIAALLVPSCRSARNADGVATESVGATPVDSSRLPALVFRDSTVHDRYCQPVPAGTDWRSVCTPRDQGVRRVMPKPPK